MCAQRDLIAASLNHCRVRPAIPRNLVAAWVMKGGLWCRARDLVSLDLSSQGVSLVPQTLTEGFDLPSPDLFGRNTEPTSIDMTTLAKAQSTLIASNPKVLLKSHVAYCKQLVGTNVLSLPGVSPGPVGGQRAGVVVKLDEKRALQEHQERMRAHKGNLPSSLAAMAMATEKGWHVRQSSAELASSLMRECERWVQRVGSYTNTLSHQARRLQEEGRFQSRSLAAVRSIWRGSARRSSVFLTEASRAEVIEGVTLLGLRQTIPYYQNGLSIWRIEEDPDETGRYRITDRLPDELFQAPCSERLRWARYVLRPARLPEWGTRAQLLWTAASRSPASTTR